MKKKFFALVFASLIAISSSSALESFIDINLSLPIWLMNDSESNISTEVRSTSVAVGFVPRVMFNDVVGLYVGIDLAFPLREDASITNGFVTNKTTVHRRDLDSWIGFYALIAPAIVPVNKEKFKLLIAPGFHYFVHWGKLTVTGIQAKLQQFCLGIGANVQAEFHFTERVYLPLGLLFAWDFFGSSHTKAGNTVITMDSGFAKWFIVQPRIGIGFHF